MKILFRRKFKKLREEYSDLGDIKLTIIENAAEKLNGSYSSFTNHDKNHYSLEDNLNDLSVTRSGEYFIKYSELIKARNTLSDILLVASIFGGFILLILACLKVAINNATLEDEYKRGHKDARDEIEKYCLNRDGKDSWVGDSSDGRHMILRISDEETDDYKDFVALLEQEAKQIAKEEATVIY